MKKMLFVFLISNQLLIAQSFDNLYFGSDTTFDVISWNIEWFPKHSNTANLVQEVLLNLEADIYALQEIQDTTLLKQIVANIPGYECYFKSSYYGGLAYVYNANTIQINAKYEIFTSEPYWNAFPRSPQVIDCNFMGDNYIIINNHFKCCGDGNLNMNNTADEENRRLQAVTFLKEFLDNNFSNNKVILLGDLNDELIDNPIDNVFQDFILDNVNYLFADMQIAEGNSADWSYPSWPSHLDHILISNELFVNTSIVSVIRIDDYMSSWNNYENNISDHRPVAIKFIPNNILYVSELKSSKDYLKVVDILGRDVVEGTKGLIFNCYDNKKVEKQITIR